MAEYACQDTGVSISVYHHMPRKSKSFREATKALYLADVGEDKAKELTPTHRRGQPPITPMEWGKIMFLIHDKGMGKGEACSELDIGYTTFQSVGKRRPGHLEACLQLYRESINSPEKLKAPASSSKKKAGNKKVVKLKASSAKKKTKVTKKVRLTADQKDQKSKLKPNLVWERFAEVCRTLMLENISVDNACKKHRLAPDTFNKYIELDVEFEGYHFRQEGLEALDVHEKLKWAR